MTARAATNALVTRFLDARTAGSIAGMVATVDEDVTFEVTGAPRRFGRDAFEAAMIHQRRCFREEVGDVVVMVSEDGTRAAAEYTRRGTYVATDAGLPEADGQRFSLAEGAFFEVEDGVLVRIALRFDPGDLRRQIAG